MFIVFFVLLSIPAVAVLALSVMYVMPATNSLFGLIWQDPTDRQRAAVARRLKELHVDGHVPNETAVLMAAKEHNATEQEIMGLLDMASPEDLMGVLTGKRTFFGTVVGKITKSLRRKR